MSKTRRNILQHQNGNGSGNRLEELFKKKEVVDTTKEIDYSLLQPVDPHTENKRRYVKNIIKNDITFCIGDAGTGKTHLAVGVAATYLSKRLVNRIILVRPIVSCDEELGFFPGDLVQKTDPYIRPLYDEFCDFFTDTQINTFCRGRRPIMEVVSLGTMKGRSFKKSFIILDEAQDATYKQLKTFLTRIGEGSKIVITGDITQSDKFNNYNDVAVYQIIRKLEGLEGIAFSELTPEDSERHPRTAQILERI
jgi:phosphate starvation-inducible PhoH-like protein